MSLEAKLDALGEQIAALTTVTTSLLNLRTEAIENVKAAAAPTTRKKKDDTPAAETKTDETPAAKPAEPAAAPATGELSEVQAAVARYVGAEGISEAERAARQGEVKKVLAHPKVNAAKVSEIPVAMAPAVIKAVEGLIAKGNLIQEEAASEAVDDLLG